MQDASLERILSKRNLLLDLKLFHLKDAVMHVLAISILLVFILAFFIHNLDSQRLELLKSKYSIRHSVLSDVNKIRKCNEASISESYSKKFYFSQLENWPKITLVCEETEKKTIVGYVLGSTSDILNEYDLSDERGLIVSLAVHPDHRGNSIAQRLLHNLRLQYALHHENIRAIILHCRVSKLWTLSCI